MTEMTPKTLRPDDLCRLADLLERPTRYGATVARDGMRACAAAWEADLRRLDGYIFDLKDERARLEAHIEALERIARAADMLRSTPAVRHILGEKHTATCGCALCDLDAALAAKSPTPKPPAPEPQILTAGWPADKETPNG